MIKNVIKHEPTNQQNRRFFSKLTSPDMTLEPKAIENLGSRGLITKESLVKS